MSSKRRLEGYLSIENPNNAPLPDMCGLVRPGIDAIVPNRKDTIFERNFYVCAHCQSTVVVQPLRTRDRAFCLPCDRIICDGCDYIRSHPPIGTEYVHMSMQKRLDLAQTAAERLVVR